MNKNLSLSVLMLSATLTMNVALAWKTETFSLNGYQVDCSITEQSGPTGRITYRVSKDPQAVAEYQCDGRAIFTATNNRGCKGRFTSTSQARIYGRDKCLFSQSPPDYWCRSVAQRCGISVDWKTDSKPNGPCAGGEYPGRKANCQGADLAMADLRRINLQEIDLRGANLHGAGLQGADLQGADLQKANLQKSDLLEANLQRANLEGANLQGANLERATWIDGRKCQVGSVGECR